MGTISRRGFFAAVAVAAGAALARSGAAAARSSSPSALRSRVLLVRTDDRVEGVERALDLFGPLSLSGKRVILKPNFNSADPFPGSTHNDTLSALVRRLWEWGAASILVVDRSGMDDTRQVMEVKGVTRLADQMGFGLLALETLASGQWREARLRNSHWSRGVLYPHLLDSGDVVVQTCNLKTHRFGGHFTLSLKNSVGIVAKYHPDDDYNYMYELHDSPAQRLMIAEINELYFPELILMDGMEAFVTGGPEAGRVAAPGVILAGKDRVALDAVGVAILRLLGTTREVSQGRIFEQEQIRRAVERGLGISSAHAIELVTDDPRSAAFAARVKEVLAAG